MNKTIIFVLILGICCYQVNSRIHEVKLKPGVVKERIGSVLIIKDYHDLVIKLDIESVIESLNLNRLPKIVDDLCMDSEHFDAIEMCHAYQNYFIYNIDYIRSKQDNIGMSLDIVKPKKSYQHIIEHDWKLEERIHILENDINYQPEENMDILDQTTNFINEKASIITNLNEILEASETNIDLLKKTNLKEEFKNMEYSLELIIRHNAINEMFDIYTQKLKKLDEILNSVSNGLIDYNLISLRDLRHFFQFKWLNELEWLMVMDAINWYHLNRLEMTTFVDENALYVVVHVPKKEKRKFTVYKLHSIPLVTSSLLTFVDVTSDYVIVDDLFNRYTTIENIDDKCQKIDQTYICHEIQPFTTERESCLYNVLASDATSDFPKDFSNCELRSMKSNNSFLISMEQKNAFIITTTETIAADLSVESEDKLRILKFTPGSTLIVSNEEAKLLTHNHLLIYVDDLLKFVDFVEDTKNIEINISIPLTGELSIDDIHVKSMNEFKLSQRNLIKLTSDLKKSIQAAKESLYIDSSIFNIKICYYVATSLIIIAFTCVFILLAIFFSKYRKAKNNLNNRIDLIHFN